MKVVSLVVVSLALGSSIAFAGEDEVGSAIQSENQVVQEGIKLLPPPPSTGGSGSGGSSSSSTTLTAPTMPEAAPTAAELTARANQPWLNQINLPYQNQLGSYNGSGVTVGIADTGAQVDHPMLSGQVVSTYNVFDKSTDVTDTVGHGTFVASEIVGTLNNGAQMQGVASGAQLAVAKVFDSSGSTTSDKVEAGVNWLVNTAHASIVSLSLGASSEIMQTAMQNGVKRGVLFTAAAGNSGGSQTEWPAHFANQSWANGQIIAVGAATQNSDGTWGLASFSNKAGDVANWYVLAPGVSITAAYPNDRYGQASGTSMATPMVAGQAALLESLWPQLSANQVAQVIFKTATHLCSDGTAGSACTSRTTADSLYGWGMINVMNSMQPVGGLTVTSSSGKTSSVTTLSIGAVKGAAAGALKTAALNGTFVVAAVDSFNRQYAYDLGQTLSTPSSHSLEQLFSASDRMMHYGEMALDDQGSRIAFASGSQTSAYLTGASPLTQLTQKNVLTGAAMVQKFKDGSEVAAGMGGMNLYFGLAGSEIPGVVSLASLSLSNPYFGLVSQASSLGYGMNVGGGVKVKLGLASSVFAGATEGQYGISAQSIPQSSMAMAEISKSFKNSVVGVEVAKLNEQNAMLGTQLGNGFSLNEPSNTVAFTLNAAYRWSDQIAIAGYISQGYTKGFDNPGDSLITHVSDARSQAFGLGVSYADAFRKDDRLMISVSSPLKTVSGQMSVNVPVNVDANGNLIRDVRSVNLSDGQREILTQASYFVALSKHSGMNTSLMYRQNADNVAGQKEAIIAMRYSRSF